ncbi:MAG: MarR family transcriptional regulator [Alphaproteobacteria bacterium]|nr:MarR family transcriptional regulator [Alphaproteobacteria bacterium]
MPGHLVRRVQQVAVRLFCECVGDDLTPVQFAALAALAQQPGLGQAALAAMIGYDRATIGGVIDRLEARGLVKRSADPQDRRSNNVALTVAGHQVFENALEQVEQVQAKLLKPLSAPEQLAFEQACLKILQHHHG